MAENTKTNKVEGAETGATETAAVVEKVPEGPEPAVVKIDDFMVGILQSLINERTQAERVIEESVKAQQAAQSKIDLYLKQSAESKGLDYDKYQFSDKDLGFVKKQATNVDKFEPRQRKGKNR